ncbi:MAG: glycosyltransferase [Candidatus Moranbacteria bacterium]|nr:glycosyltransferase [Candidatus Moranbacteria bacterium]
MKIAIFTNNYLPNPYGVTGSVETFRKYFEEKGHTVYIFAPDWHGYTDNNPHVFRYPSLDLPWLKFRFPVPLSWATRTAQKNVDMQSIDIIHAQHPNLLGAEAKRVAKKYQKPIVFTWHTRYDYYTHFAPFFIPESLALNYVIKNASSFANSVDQVVVPTHSMEPIIRSWGVENPHVKDVATGVDEKLFTDTNPEKIKKDLNIPKGAQVITTIARFTQEKNVDFLFEKVANILQQQKDTIFLLIGGGPLLDDIRRKAKEMNVQKQVFFAGEVKREEMKHYYATADIFVYASKSETQGMVISEAMYMNVPVVAIKATGIVDLVEDGKTGLLLTSQENDEFEKAILKLIQNKELRKQYAQASGKSAREVFTAQAQGEKMLALYEQVIERKKREK